MYYRYELWIEGAPQNIGFLQGLEDAGFTSEEWKTLVAPFDEILPMPPDGLLSEYRTFSWFTEYGVDVCRPYIDAVICAYEEKGDFWEVVRLERERLEDVVYSDDFQVLTLMT